MFRRTNGFTSQAAAFVAARQKYCNAAWRPFGWPCWPHCPWPRLADVSFPTAAPDPATGDAVIAALSAAAAASAARADAASASVMTQAEANRLRDAGRRSQ